MMSRLCINTEITITVKYNEYSQRVEIVVLQSTEFNTVPVIFKSIHLEGRSQPVVETVDNGNGIFHRIKFCFFISYRYVLFRRFVRNVKESVRRFDLFHFRNNARTFN